MATTTGPRARRTARPVARRPQVGVDRNIKHPKYGKAGGKVERCAEHAAAGMVDLVKCGNNGCATYRTARPVPVAGAVCRARGGLDAERPPLQDVRPSWLHAGDNAQQGRH